MYNTAKKNLSNNVKKFQSRINPFIRASLKKMSYNNQAKDKINNVYKLRT